MNLVEVYEAARGRVQASTPWTWTCWGDTTQYLVFEDNRAACVFDRKDGQVYALEIFDMINSQAYRWVDPDQWPAYYAACQAQNIDPDFAYEGVDFQDLPAEIALIKLNELTPETPLSELIKNDPT